MLKINDTTLTKRQREVLDFMRAFYARNDQLPPMAFISRHFGWKSQNAAQTFADILAAKGFIEKNDVGRYRFTRQAIEDTAAPPPAAGELVRLPVRDMHATHAWGRGRA